MINESILFAIDTEISTLEQVKRLLGGTQSRSRKTSARHKGRPGRTLSAQARARISAAQKKRWAAAKKSAK